MEETETMTPKKSPEPNAVVAVRAAGMKRFASFLVPLLLCGCTQIAGKPDSEAKTAEPFTIRFIEMVQKNGIMLPKVEIVNQTGKSINGVEFDYRCFDRFGRDITITNIQDGLHSWGMTGAEPPAEPLFLPKSTNSAIVGSDTSWIPDGTVRITAVPVWAKFADGTEWNKN